MTTPGVDEFDWERVVPRIVNPNKVAIIELLQRQREPLSASRMKNLIDNPEVTLQLLIYHCITLEKAGVLEIVPTPPSAAANERFYCFAPQE